MKDIVIQLLNKLYESDKPLGSKECSDLFEISESKFKGIVKEINNELTANGAMIIGKTGRGNGYTLNISDQEKFSHYLHTVLPKEIQKESEYFNNQDARISYIIQRLLQMDSFIKADDLADELIISKSQLSKDLKLVRKKISSVGIEIINKPYKGLRISADERHVRQCLAHLESKKMFTSDISTMYSQDTMTNRKLAQIKAIIIQECERYHYTLTDMICQNLVTHLYVAMKRVLNRFDVAFSDEDKGKIESEPEFMLARAIINDIKLVFDINLPESEIYYCTIHLSSKKTVDGQYIISKEVRNLVKEILEHVKKIRNFDFTGDFQLALKLSLHLVPLLSRITYHLELKNPLLDEIKARYILAYDIATVCVDYINHEYDCNLSEHEISYFALHFQLSMNEQQVSEKKNVLIVCSTGRGSAELLKARFVEEYGKYVKKITTCDYLDALKMDMAQFDLIFSTIPLQKKFEQPVVIISHFITEKDDEKIMKVLKNYRYDDFIKFFDKNLFVKDINVKSKEEAIEIMVDRIKEFHDLPAEFYDSVMERDQLANTVFADYVAMPHPYRIITENTIICVGILEESIRWDNDQEVKIILLCSFASSFNKKNEDFFKVLSELISSKRTIRELANAGDYETFTKVIREKIGD